MYEVILCQPIGLLFITIRPRIKSLSLVYTSPVRLILAVPCLFVQGPIPFIDSIVRVLKYKYEGLAVCCLLFTQGY